MFAFFHDDVFRAELVDLARGFDEVVFLGELLSFGFVEDEAVDATQEFQQIGQSDVEPKVHRVSDDEFGTAHLVEDVVLQRRRDVGQQDEWALAIGLRQARGERFEYAEFGLERAAIVHVQLIFAGPMECFAGRDLQTFEVDLVLFVERDVVLREIFTDDADEFDGREKARGDGGMTGGTAEQARVLRIRGANGIKGCGTDY